MEVKALTEAPVKRVLICCNGFINLKKHACEELKEYFDSINNDKNREIVLVDLYDPEDKKTYNRKKQIAVLERLVKKYSDQNHIIYLLGYSYTAGVCARVASKTRLVKKLVLVSPTLYLIKTKLLFSYLKVAKKFIQLKMKRNASSQKTIDRLKIEGIIPISYNIARSIFKNRKYFKKVRCRTFIGKAQNDDLCVGKTLWKITHKLESNRVTLKSYPTGGHTMIMHKEVGLPCFEDILSFTFHITNPEEKKEENEERLTTISFDPIKTDESYFD